MKITTDSFQQVVNTTGRAFNARLVINNNVYDNQEIIEAKLSHELVEGELTLGNISSTRLDLRTVNIPKEELRGEIILEIGMLVNDEFEYVEMGRFWANDIVDKERKIVQTTAFDKFYYLEKPINIQNLNLESSMQEIIDEICTSNSIEPFAVDVSEDVLYINTLLRGRTERELLSFIAEYHGGYFLLEKNALKLVRFTNSEVLKLDGDIYYEVDFGETAKLKSIEKYFEDENEWQTIEDETVENGVIINVNAENFFVSKERLEIIFSHVQGKKFTKFDVTTIGNLSIEVSDSILIETVKGEKINSFITEYSYVYNGTFSATYSCGIATSTRDGDYSSTEHVGTGEKQELVVYQFENLQDFSIKGEEGVELIKMQFVSTNGKTAILNGTIRLSLDRDGIFELRTVRDLLLVENLTKRYYLQRGEHAIVVNESFELSSNKRNEICLHGCTYYFESDVRKQDVQNKNNQAKITSLTDYMTTGQYVAPEEIALDTTVPTATIAFGGVRTVIFAQGISANIAIWDGNFDIVEQTPTFTLGECKQPLTLQPLKETISTRIQLPNAVSFVEQTPTFTLGECKQPLVLKNISEWIGVGSLYTSDTIDVEKTTNYNAEFVEIIAESFVLRKGYVSGTSSEIEIDSGLACELAIVTDIYERVDRIEVK